MTQLVLHGPPQSSYVRTARMIAIEKGLDARLEPVEFKSPAHLAMHPWGRVPILRHGSVELIETVAIGHYLDAIGTGPSLVPAEPVRRAESEQWISVINAYVYADVVLNYVFHYIFPKTESKQPDRALITRDAPAVERDLRRIEQGFRGEWLTGSTLSLADLFLAPILGYAAMFPEAQAVLETCPNLRRFHGAITQRKSFVDTTPPRPAR
ncbi:MAG: glutathione S-transferase family protein [Kofleriaceae bacterium]|jgi:glutathione S-transferase|nr:glutathione S-transferase family protein [Kofleriaceae bacterium]MBP8812131.1 glutathione S-transferase family protein [Kofleriaceae bacterium]MBP9202431.1 glutathione S-transferase family protein [Kofleriaceae bacterium]